MEIPREVTELRPKLLGAADDEQGCELLWMGHYLEAARFEFAHESWLRRAVEVLQKRIARRYVRREIHRKSRRNGGSR